MNEKTSETLLRGDRASVLAAVTMLTQTWGAWFGYIAGGWGVACSCIVLFACLVWAFVDLRRAGDTKGQQP